MEILRLHCLGNDYLVAEAEAQQFSLSSLAREFCRLDHGMGCAGLIFLCPGQPGSWRLEVYNYKGGRIPAETGAFRCAGYYLGDGGWELGTEFGFQRVDVQGGSTDLRFPPPVLGREYQVGQDFYGQVVSLGQSYFVTSVHRLASLNLDLHGQAIYNYFGGINCVFFQDYKNVEVRVWRDGREASSSGQGACAAAAVLLRLGKWREPMSVEMSGGTVEIWVDRLGDFVQRAAVRQILSFRPDGELLAKIKI